MNYCHDEQESITRLKLWWVQWGSIVTWIALAMLIIAVAWNIWNFWQRREAKYAAVLYDQVQQAVHLGDKAMVNRIAVDMEKRYGGTAYAQLTALTAAKELYAVGDTIGAKMQLQWATKYAKNSEFRQLAKLRLASLLLDEQAYEQGLALLAEPESDQFIGIVADGRGDLLAATGKHEEARVAYKRALNLLPQNDIAFRQLIEFKLDELGS